MANLIRPTKIITKDGEIAVHLTIDLNIHVDGAGGVSLKEKKAEDEAVDWAIPDFGQGGLSFNKEKK